MPGSGVKSNKTILITGSNKGIGFETARQCGRAGMHVWMSGRDPEKLEKAVQQLIREDIPAHFLLMDVSRQESIDAAAEFFRQTGKTLDVLVNNAGILFRNDADLATDDPHILEQTLATNALGALRVSQAFLPFMTEGGRIIMLSSGGGSMSEPIGGWSPAYCVSKTVLNAITRHLDYSLSERGISVYAIDPGWVQTDMGGTSAPLPIDKGPETILWLATQPSQIKSGTLYHRKQQVPW